MADISTHAEAAREKTARVQIATLGTALHAYALDVGRYPSSSIGLDALVNAPADTDRWDGPYLTGRSIPKDPWGAAFGYSEPTASRGYEIRSFGPDGKRSDDDISSNDF